MNEHSRHIPMRGLDHDEKSALQGFLEDAREELIRLYERVRVPELEVDVRIRAMADRLHDRNERRAASYGLPYPKPNILHLDAFGLHDVMAVEIRNVIAESRLRGLPVDVTKQTGRLMTFPNTVVIPVRAFDDPEADAYFTASILRHEMDHAGEFRQIHGEASDNAIHLRLCRVGAGVGEKPGKGEPEDGAQKTVLGFAIDEGHMSIRDEIAGAAVTGESLRTGEDKRKYGEQFFFGEPDLKAEFADGVRRYRDIEARLRDRNKIESGRILTGRKDLGSTPLVINERFITADGYNAFRRLMMRIYDADVELFGLADGFIYGNRVKPFAQRIDIVFGRGFFRTLMRVKTDRQAEELLATLT